MRPQGEKPAAGARHARLSFDRLSPSEENNKPAKSLRQRLEEAGIDVLPSENPTREVFAEESLRARGFIVPVDGFIIPVGGPIRSKP
jgi:hypothetical protein